MKKKSVTEKPKLAELVNVPGMSGKYKYEPVKNWKENPGTKPEQKIMSGKLNDQMPKPALGNSITAHGRLNTDNSGGAGPSKNRPVKPHKGKQNAR
jgi:hypothetical protein